MSNLTKKIITSFTIFYFILYQIVPPVVAGTLTEEELASSSQLVQPTKDFGVTETSITPIPTATEASSLTTQDFLQDETPLTKADEDSNVTESEKENTESKEENVGDETLNSTEDLPVYSFDQLFDTLGKLTPGYAGAYLVEKLTVESLRALTELSYEVAFVAAAGVGLVFTSKDKEGIQIPSTVTSLLKSLFEQNALLFHTHPEGERPEPSLSDIELAGQLGLPKEHVEYVVSKNKTGGEEISVYGFNQYGVVKGPIQDEHSLVVAVDAIQNKTLTSNISDLIHRILDIFNHWGQDLQTLELFRSADPPTVFSGSPVLSSFASSSPAGSVTITQPSSSFFRMDYNVSNSGSFVGAVISWGSKPQDLSGFDKFTFEMRTDNSCIGKPCLKVEFVDSNDRKATVQIQSLNSTFQQVDISKTVLLLSNPNLDFVHIKQINFVEDSVITNPKIGFLEMNTGGLDFIPIVNGTTYDQSVLTTLPGAPLASASKNDADNDASLSFSQTSPRDFTFSTTLPDATDFSFVTLVFQGFQSLSSLVLALNIPSAKRLRAEVYDKNGLAADFDLVGTGVKQNYTLNLSGDNLPPGFLTGALTQIVLVADPTHVGNSSTTIVVETKGLDFTPTVNGTSFNEASLATLTNSPFVTAAGANSVTGQPNGIIEATTLSSGEFEMVYDLTPSASSFTFVNVSDGFFDQNGVFQGTLTSLPQNFVIAARGHEGSKVRVEITDSARRTADFTLNLRPIYQNYTLSLAGDNVPAGFDITQIASIIFVEDRNLSGASLNDLVKVKVHGLNFSPPILPAPLEQVKQSLIQEGLTFFQTGKGLDPTTHLPYDSIEANGLPDSSAKFTQPTLVGFYLQVLGEVIDGKVNNGLTVDQALTEIDTVLTRLLSAQASFGWNGLLPWMDLDPTLAPYNRTIGLGDNAALAQSLAVMVGSLESANLTPTQRTAANGLTTKVDQFLNNQAPGYAAFVDPTFGIFRQAFIRDTLTSNTGTFDNFTDRVANEFRGAVAFLKVRYPSLPSTVWTGLQVVTRNYTDRNGNTIQNLAYFDGSAFQAFWPLLRNNERDFIGFRNALTNALVTFSDYSFQNRIPGFVSASQRPDALLSGDYYGRIGIRQIAESGISHASQFLIDVGSTYALASALAIDDFSVLNWLNAIEDQLPALNADQGFFDSSRSNTEIARRILGIDVSSTILGLSAAGPEAFETYLRNRNLELAYNLLYDSTAHSFAIQETTQSVPAPPEFSDRSRAVFSHFTSEGSINSFPTNPASFTGVRFTYGTLTGGFGGQFWVLDQNYDATANQLVISYSVVNSPQSIKIELKDELDQLLFSATPTLINSSNDQRLVINLPNQTKLAAVRKILIVIDQNATQDFSGDFTLRAIDFQHVPSSQNLEPASSLSSSDVTVLPGTPPAQLFSSNPNSSLDRPSSSLTGLNYDLSNPGDFAGFSINFDPSNNGSSADLSGLNKIVFGVDSSTVNSLKIEIDDANGNRAVFYVQNIDVTRNYYEFLTSLVAGSIDLTKVKRINFVVDNSSINPGGEIGSLQIELGGLKFP